IDENSPRYFIIDCSSIAYVDYMGAKALAETATDQEKRGVTVYLTAVKPNVRAVLDAQGRHFSEECIFPTLHDALSIAERNESTAENAVKGPAVEPTE
ncbi:hypothetical protein PENTCL1PPCAC_282, partial [Pristionchus entomophagus]